MELHTSPYLEQKAGWPAEGRQILAQYDEHSVVVYQAYRPLIGHFAAQRRYFGGDFSLQRMSWIKTSFLWMMYRSGWGTKLNQEVTLAIRLKRPFFDSILSRAVRSSYDPDLYPGVAGWKRAVASSEVRLQWDPDHDPSGARVRRRAIQLGLRGQVLAEYAHDAIVEVMDISAFVAEQRIHAESGGYARLVTPTERAYLPASPEVARRLKLSNAGT